MKDHTKDYVADSPFRVMVDHGSSHLLLFWPTLDLQEAPQQLWLSYEPCSFDYGSLTQVWFSDLGGSTRLFFLGI